MSQIFTTVQAYNNYVFTEEIYTEAYHIICSLCRSTHVESKKLDFPFYIFSVNYYDFSKIQPK